MLNHHPSPLRTIYWLPIIFYPILILCGELTTLPYYFGWDSSLLYATDSLLINGGMTPAHLFHPDIGALWFEKFFIFPVAKFLGLISISTIQELQNSLNPALNMAEITQFLLYLRHSYLYVAASIIYIFTLKLLAFPLKESSPWQRFCVAAVSAIFSFTYAYGGIFYSFIRYEFAGVLWFSLALLSTLYALKTGRKIFILIAGFCAGWAFISKIVLLPSVFVLVLLFVLLRGLYCDEPLLCSKKERKQTLWLSALYAGIVLAALVFIGVMIIKYSFDRTALDTGALMHSLRLTHLLLTGALFPLFLVAQLFVAIFLYKRVEEFNGFAYYFHRLVLFSVFFFLPMILIVFQNKGLHIFTNVYIFSFALGQVSMSQTTGHNDSLGRIAGNFSLVNIVAFLSLCAIGGLGYFYALKKNKKITPLALAFLSLGGVHLVHMIFLRGNETSLPLYNIFIMLSATLLIAYTQFFHYHRHLWAILCLALMLLGTAYVGKKIIVSRTLGPLGDHPLFYSPYFNSLGPWYTFHYNERAALYTTALANTYQSQENWEKGFFWSRDIRNTRQLLQALRGNPNSLQDSALIFPGSKLSPKGETVISASSELRSALALPIIKDGSVFFRSDFDFYLVFASPLETEFDLLEATSLEFKTSESETFHVYKFLKKEFSYDKPYSFSFTTNMQFRYLLIADGIAQNL